MDYVVHYKRSVAAATDGGCEPMNWERLAAWHKTKLGLLVFGGAALLIAYGFASLAIERGTLWWYLATLIFFVGGVHNLVKLVQKSVTK
jgi:hypothetical protein